ncbi:MAG TPA: LCCL domain-containing protein [Archangium sp.]|uniref:LCCL domain-containing protein n=1 Tax=Archangium sp. TaxID=1872627 RepID=UPI002E321AE9|nr:LCCL domain-containing protein [Archangium sp.]HEX5754671.1 LCCL domain-containing protein [Archangium sp.]
MNTRGTKWGLRSWALGVWLVGVGCGPASGELLTPEQVEAPGAVQQALQCTPCPSDLKSYRGQNGLQYTCHCTAADTASGWVWGTDVYTDDSSLCRAALHAGAVSPVGGLVVATIAPGQDNYSGSSRNGVGSFPFSNWYGSFSVAAATSACKPLCPANASALRGRNGYQLDCECPASATTSGSLWGTGVYTDDSSLCRAAVHAGALTTAGGPLTAYIQPGQTGYTGSTRNGVTSSAYSGSWSGSVRIAQRYPERPPMRIKALQPDGWANKDEISGHNTGGVVVNLVWLRWEPTPKAAPCVAGEAEYAGRCFVVNAALENDVREWNARGMAVTAVLYGVPDWARVNRPCGKTGNFARFCAPDNPADFGRFAGMLARYFNGLEGHGHIADFVLHNEVNANEWFDIGCGSGLGACDAQRWMDEYAANFNAAYDRITAEQPNAKVFIPLTHHFGPELDAPGALSPVLSASTFLTGFNARLGGRAWRVAHHPYPPGKGPQFSAEDYPRVTYGNLGVLAGWLRKSFPDKPWTWELHLTESGVNSLAPDSSEGAQATAVCDSLRNVLGTPGIESYVYHRMMDHAAEVAQGLGLGLRRGDGSAKPAWATWALANLDTASPPQLSCGFEELPYTRLRRYNSPTRGHWTSSRLPPAGFTLEGAWRLWREPRPGTHLLYECQVGGHNLVSVDVNCEGLLPLGPVGYAHDTQVAGTVPLYRCRVGELTDHFVSGEGCEGYTQEGLLGYVFP